MHKKKSIYYATSNNGKFSEVERYCKNYAPDVAVTQFKYDLPELQNSDQIAVAINKAETAWNLLQKPVLIDDSGLFIDRYRGFPGTMSKYAMHSLGLEGIMRLIDDQEPAQFIVTLAYAWAPGEIKTFQGICIGHLIKVAEIPHKDHLPYSNFFIPEGHYLPYAQLRGTPAEKIFGPRHKALTHFFDWFLSE